MTNMIAQTQNLIEADDESHIFPGENWEDFDEN